jgi:drug/metabolite transporter (DMT)-like permease
MRRLLFAPPYTAKLILAYFAVYFIWGSTYFAISVVVREVPPLYAAGIRFTIAGGLLVAWAVFRGEKMPVGREWLSPLVVALFLLMLTNGSTSIACLMIPSGTVALIQSLSPGLTVFWDRFFFHKESYRMRNYIGVFAGMLGVAILVLTRSGGEISFQVRPAGVAIIIFGISCWSFGSLLGKDIPGPASNIVNSGLGMVIAGPMLFLAGNFVDWSSVYSFSPVSYRSVLGIAYLALFGSVGAFSSHCWLMRVEPPSRVATSTFVNPVIAIFLGATLGEEILTARMAVAAVVIIGSISLIWKK